MRERKVSEKRQLQAHCLRYLKCFGLLLVFAAITYGCNVQQPNKKGYTVMFESMPKFAGTSILYNGQTVGNILSAQVGQGGIAKITADLDSDFVRQSGYAFVFCVRNGGLEIEKLRSVGEPMDIKDTLYGFSSGSGLAWFKFKTLIRNRMHAVRRQADKLYQRFQPVER